MTVLKLQVKSSHLYLYSAFNNTDGVKALNSIKLEDRVSVMYNNKIKHSITTLLLISLLASIKPSSFLRFFIETYVCGVQNYYCGLDNLF